MHHTLAADAGQLPGFGICDIRRKLLEPPKAEIADALREVLRYQKRKRDGVRKFY